MARNRNTETLILSWQALHADARRLAHRVTVHGPFHSIAAVTRGGLVPAAIIARELRIRMIDTICIASYDERTQVQPRLLKRIDGTGDGFLVIDDLVDTGVTARLIRDMLPQAHYATVYAKPEGRALVDDFAIEIRQNVWVEFPWDLGAPDEFSEDVSD